jgi:hypothetical protein
LSNIRFGGEREESESKRAERGLERRRETEREIKRGMIDILSWTEIERREDNFKAGIQAMLHPIQV